jgi:TetR/AcrR family transcriptional repressor of bet genes
MTDIDALPPDDRKPRKASREARKVQLMEATIDVLARDGFSRTTLTEVARRAGLSHGLVNFHFASKERLLAETLAYLAEEYRENWTRALAAAGVRPAEQLAALLGADFAPAVSTPARLAAWCAFWGEAQSRPMYQDSCGDKDLAYNATLEGICAALLAEDGCAADPVIVARVLRVTIEGVWLDMMTMAAPYSRDEALRTVHSCAAAFFPRHFDPNGLTR